MSLSRRQLVTWGTAAMTASFGLPVRAHEAGVSVDDAVAVPQPMLVTFPSSLPAGEIHVDPDNFSLFLTLGGREGLRYACGIGRAGLYEAGTFFVGAKKEWPSWTPTSDMIAREPEHYEQFADGMPGGPDNPLGARALYLFTPQGGDSFLRIHGTNDPSTIGTAVSNGCARLTNAQIVDLYDQVPVDTVVYLYPSQRPGY